MDLPKTKRIVVRNYWQTFYFPDSSVGCRLKNSGTVAVEVLFGEDESDSYRMDPGEVISNLSIDGSLTSMRYKSDVLLGSISTIIWR